MPARTRDTGRAGSSNQSASSNRTGHYGRSYGGRRPRSTAQEEEEDGEEEEEPPARRRRVGESSNGRRHEEETPNEEEEGDEEEDEAEGEGEGGDVDASDGEANVTGLRPREKLPVSEAIRNMVQAMEKEGKDGIKRKANDLARLALFSELRRTPLRRSDISIKVFKKENSRIFPVVFNHAQKILRSSFGYEMVELRARGTDNEQILLAQSQAQTQRRRAPEKEDEKDTKVKGVLSKSYVLVSVLPNKLISRITQPSATLEHVPDYTVGGNRGNISGTEGVLLDWKRSNADLGKTGLTMLILALVLVNNRVMPEDQLRSYLRRMGLKGILPESLQSHPELASGGLVGRDSDGIMLDDFLANLVKQDYLERTRVSTTAATSAASMDASMARRRTQARGNVKRTRNGDSDAVEDFELRWGSRAEVEIGETAAASFIADICLKNNNADLEEEEEEEEQEAETQNGLGSARERRKKRREQILREVQRAAGSSLVV